MIKSAILIFCQIFFIFLYKSINLKNVQSFMAIANVIQEIRLVKDWWSECVFLSPGNMGVFYRSPGAGEVNYDSRAGTGKHIYHYVALCLKFPNLLVCRLKFSCRSLFYGPECKISKIFWRQSSLLNLLFLKNGTKLNIKTLHTCYSYNKLTFRASFVFILKVMPLIRPEMRQNLLEFLSSTDFRFQ